MEWLLSPIDPARNHEISFLISWHARTMFIVWSFAFPFGIILARFFKVVPGQDWPNRLDNKIWWHGHLFLQYTGGGLLILALWFIWAGRGLSFDMKFHHITGWLAVFCCLVQFISGLARGSKGGPTDKMSTDGFGDHYNMTSRRLVFEFIHKSVGYFAIIFALSSILSGLWFVNAQMWIWLIVVLWWMFLLLIFIFLQKVGFAVDTYQAIWGPDKEHPGNSMKPIGLGIRRIQKKNTKNQHF